MNLKSNWKMYVSLVLYALLGLAIGYGVAKGVMYFTNNKDAKMEEHMMDEDEMMMASTSAKYKGSLMNGENKFNFSFIYDKNLSVSQGEGDKAKYVYVKDGEKNVAVLYFSYEGARNYSAADYVAKVIAPRVALVGSPETMMHASSTWMHVASAGTDWHLVPVADGKWVVVLESSKANKSMVASILETFKEVKMDAMMSDDKMMDDDKKMDDKMMDEKKSDSMMLEDGATMELKKN